MTPKFHRAQRMSSWRRLAVHVWGRPADPTVYANIDIDMRQALAWIEEAEATSGIRITVTHLVVKAIAQALAAQPDANAIISSGRIWMRNGIDIYCQIATDQGADLSGAKVEAADTKSVIEIARELAERIERVRAHKDLGSERTKASLGRVPDRLLRPMLRAVEWLTYDRRLDLSRFGIAFDQFGSAMVSNVGGFRVGHALAPLVPVSRVPIVLLVAGVHDRPLAENGVVIVAPMMTIGCTFDHRLIDGYQGSMMAGVVTQVLTDPYAELGAP
ncbi:MAG: pyruvate/2-oxoglutarate dehydrogenase complex dihydrolipoamide acyltransferase (E2) component [Hyphomicrobiaceae bacterium]|jgi:pyruvate/2-oxoglutarate dehydrogenase complex dihydrolipoamide acyltransferase (E2) component